MNSIVYTIIMVALWVLNLFNDSGLGHIYQTTERARTIIVLLFIIVIMFQCKEKQFWVEKRDFTIFGGLSLIIIAISKLKGYGNMGFHYISAFMLVYILGQVKIHLLAIRLTGLVYVILGMSILYIYDYATLLSGWNGNTIGMIGLYSFLIFLISFYDTKNIKSKIIIVIITGIYIHLIEPTDSRSSIWFAIVAVLFALSILPRKIITVTDKRYYLWLLIPLFIAIIVVNVSHGSYMNELDLWSMEKFQKPIFNGRGELWENGLSLLREHFLFGRGTVEGNWHNCAITILTAYGCVGGIFWILSLQKILSKGRYWINDIIVSGCIITFVIMYIQQSVELGLVNENPNILPYIVLGIMLGRVKQLDEKEIENVEGEYEKDKYYSSDL